MHKGMGLSLLLGFPAFVVDRIGGKKGLIFAISSYCIYPLAYFIAALVDDGMVCITILSLTGSILVHC